MNNTREVVIKNQEHNHSEESDTEIESYEIITFDEAMKMINEGQCSV